MIWLSLFIPAIYMLVSAFYAEHILENKNKSLLYKQYSHRVLPYFNALLFLLLIVIVLFRGEYGTDYDNYYGYFSGTQEHGQLGLLFSIVFEDLEFYRLPAAPHIAFFMIGALYLYLLDYLAREFDCFYYYIIFYFASLLLHPNMLGSLRQGLAILLSSISLVTYLKDRKLTSIVLMTIAISFHSASIITLVAFLRVSRDRKILIGTIAFILLLFLMMWYQWDEIQYKLIFYSTAEGYTGATTDQFYGKLLYLPVIIFVWLESKFTQKIAITIIFCVASIIPYVFEGFPIIVERIGGYFEIYKLLILYNISKNREKEYPVAWAMFLVLLSVSTIYKIYTHLLTWNLYFLRL